MVFGPAGVSRLPFPGLWAGEFLRSGLSDRHVPDGPRSWKDWRELPAAHMQRILQHISPGNAAHQSLWGCGVTQICLLLSWGTRAPLPSTCRRFSWTLWHTGLSPWYCQTWTSSPFWFRTTKEGRGFISVWCWSPFLWTVSMEGCENVSTPTPLQSKQGFVFFFKVHFASSHQRWVPELATQRASVFPLELNGNWQRLL